MTEKKTYREAIDYLFGLQRFGIKLGLVNITALLKELGDPQASLKAVHIAGTNGKGSTAAFLTSILDRAGYRVGLYTSPHLVDFTERIQVNGVPIPRETVIQMTGRIRRVISRMERKGELWSKPPSGRVGAFDPRKTTITFFEFITAMAFLYFRKEGVEVAVLEAGMGGRLDATNVIVPLISLITPISLEHQQYLGKTLVQIAGEKAGIIKAGRPLLTSVSGPRVLSLFEGRCRGLGSPLYAWGRDFRGKETGPQMMNFHGRSHEWTGLRLGLAGTHQIRNASLALAATEVLMELGFALEEHHLRSGLAETRWAGRLELIGGSPRILLDGAHNPGATSILRKNLDKYFPRRKLILVLGIMADKDMPRMISHLAPLADLLILTRPRMDRAASPGLLHSLAAPFGKTAIEVEGVGSALEFALKRTGKKDLIVVTGSLFTVGEARAYLTERGMLPSS